MIIQINFYCTLVKLPVTDDCGFPVTARGKTRFAGLCFLGMPWLYKQRSGLLLGVAQDAAHLAEQVAAPWMGVLRGQINSQAARTSLLYKDHLD